MIITSHTSPTLRLVDLNLSSLVLGTSLSIVPVTLCRLPEGNDIEEIQRYL
jgi:hypothetical protein